MPTKPIPIDLSRPGTLAEAARLEAIHGSASRPFLIAGFLDEFYSDRDAKSRRNRLTDAPAITHDAKTDALYGAIGEHLCHRWILGAPPSWTNHKARFLHQPWFLGPERMKPFLLAESPSAYRRRFIFAEAEPLRRASMPRDGRWWYYEQLRTSLSPADPSEIAPPCRAPGALSS